MEATLNIRISAAMQDELRELCEQQHRSTSDVVRDSLQKYLAVDQMNRLREKLRPRAEAAGFLTDEDVFKAVS
ncbi:MAG: CopG family transcriptional regulator [Planctomycetota bacterium]|nr:MAG: CopG family transcriptional regulator [Planctomycetota bacterium]